MEDCSVGVAVSQAILQRPANPKYQEILDPENSEVISQTHLFDDKPDCQRDEASSFVNLDCTCVFNDSLDFYTGKYSDILVSSSSIKHDNIHLLDSAEPDIQFVVQFEDNVGRSEAESNISLDLHNKSNVRRGSVQQMFYYAQTTK